MYTHGNGICLNTATTTLVTKWSMSAGGERKKWIGIGAKFKRCSAEDRPKKTIIAKAIRVATQKVTRQHVYLERRA